MLRRSKPVELLIAEDNPGDVELIREALRDSPLQINLNIVNDGTKAIDYLYKTGNYKNATRPDLILLDLNLPKKDGREVLSEIKSDVSLKVIPVVILTTSSAEDDIWNAYYLGANCYITKPIGLDNFFKIIKYIEEFWCNLIKLPIV